jgi:hypothetical protein
MKKIILVSLFLLSFLVLPTLALGQIPPAESTTPQSLPTRSVFTVADTLFRWMFTLLLMAAVIAILVAAYYFVTAGGDATRVQTARQFVLYAVIAVIVAGVAWGLIAIARTIVQGGGGTNETH